jgi:hypothetical protein
MLILNLSAGCEGELPSILPELANSKEKVIYDAIYEGPNNFDAIKSHHTSSVQFFNILIPSAVVCIFLFSISLKISSSGCVILCAIQTL